MPQGWRKSSNTDGHVIFRKGATMDSGTLQPLVGDDALAPHRRGSRLIWINPLPFSVGCFDPAKTVAYSTLEVSSERPRLVLDVSGLVCRQHQMTDGGDELHDDGMEHSPTSATGTGWERTPWHATQRAAWEALQKARGA